MATGRCQRNSALIEAVRAGEKELPLKPQLAQDGKELGLVVIIRRQVLRVQRCECGETGKAFCSLLEDYPILVLSSPSLLPCLEIVGVTSLFQICREHMLGHTCFLRNQLLLRSAAWELRLHGLRATGISPSTTKADQALTVSQGRIHVPQELADSSCLPLAQGYTSQQEFIATQGPLKKTIEDFWRLVWEQNVCNIIMLTVCMENGRVLCDHYWPSESAPVSYGQVRVHLLMQSSSEEWTMREFKLWHAERHVSHLHYTAWPDHGIPESTTSIMTFRELVREHIQSTKDAGPTLVHCSAGVGRTGTFIALDRLLQQMKQEKVVDTFGVVYALRMNRYQMIQTLSQYIFLHSCILEKILEEPLLSLSQTER
uniref:Protein tyrosine phosphatase receptor type N n=1 Tax=Athene cunicularia TaxID=194338 RepID=A0A663LTF1_ATHCN